ncbi:MAG TPA: formate dehydrogenase accessory sulfurtransferase FdhD [Actinocrinis sp.]|jgi:FdhD protein
MGRLTQRAAIVRLDGAGRSGARDTVVAEEPLEIRVGGRQIAVTMRTPGDDFDLVAGYLVGEGVVRKREQLATMRFCDHASCAGVPGAEDVEELHDPYNVVDVDLAAGVAPPSWSLDRTTYTTSACGVCGKTSIAAVRANAHWSVEDDPVRVQPETLYGLPEAMREHQRLFAKTGGLHAAGVFAMDGRLLCLREDVGRHNAVDKVVGWALREDRLPLRGCLLAVSGRASFELVQKAAAAGIPVLAAVSAPSSLAVELAQAAGLTLVGFVRGHTANVYSRGDRIVDGAPVSG